MDKVKEAKGAVEKHASIYHERTMKPCCQDVLRELMLAVHVEACGAYDCELTDENRHLYQEKHRHQACGDGWLCERAKALKELAS